MNEIKKYKQENEYVKIYRTITKHPIYCYLLDISNELLLLHVIEDFHTDGFQIIRYKDINSINCKKYQKFKREILKKEGIEKKIGLKNNINIESWQTVFSSLKQYYEIIIVEGEEDDVDEFLIGKVDKIEDTKIGMTWFDAAGKWSKKKYYPPYNEITSVKFDNEYINVWKKYV